MLGCLRSNNQQPHPSADRLLKVFLSSQPPLSIPIDIALPTRETKQNSTHQWAGTSLSHQEACTSLLDQPHSPEGRHHKEEELQSFSLQNEDHKHRKIDKMRQKRNMFQTKEQDKTLEKQLSEVEKGNLPEKEFSVMIVKMIQDLRKRMEAQIEMIQEIFNKELEDLKNNQRLTTQ